MLIRLKNEVMLTWSDSDMTVLRSEIRLCLTLGSCVDPKESRMRQQTAGANQLFARVLHSTYNIAPKS
jgi:hypothetical protein